MGKCRREQISGRQDQVRRTGQVFPEEMKIELRIEKVLVNQTEKKKKKQWNMSDKGQ